MTMGVTLSAMLSFIEHTGHSMNDINAERPNPQGKCAEAKMLAQYMSRAWNNSATSAVVSNTTVTVSFPSSPLGTINTLFKARPMYYKYAIKITHGIQS